MKKTITKLLSITTVAIMSMTISIFSPITANAKDQSINLTGMVYQFEKSSEYEVDSSQPTYKSENIQTLGKLSITGDISQEYVKDNFTAYEIADGSVISLQYKYESYLKNAIKTEWHLAEDSKNVVNKVDLGDDIDYGAIILQTSFNGEKWFTAKSYRNVTGDITFNEDNGINDIQLVNGCFYRVIVAYKTEKDESKKRSFTNPIIDTECQNYAEVYSFYAGYKKSDTEVVGQEFNSCVCPDTSLLP